MLLAFVPSLFATVALALSCTSNFWCETIAFQPLTTGGDNGDNSAMPDITLGPFYVMEVVTNAVSTPGAQNYYTVGKACVMLSSSVYKDANWKTTQAFAIITAIVGGVTLFWTWLSPCLNRGASFWKMCGFAYILCSIFQGLTLLFLQSDACHNNTLINTQSVSYYNDTCVWDWGTKTNISSVVFWFLAGSLMIGVIPPAQTPERPPAETQTVTYAQNPDGTISETGVVKGTYIPSEQP